MRVAPDFYGGNPEPGFLTLRRHGVREVFLKATEGLTWTDSSFVRRRRRAIAAGLRPIPYHFARPDLHPHGARDEARHFVAVVGARKIRRLGLVLDFERECHNCGPMANQAWARAFSQTVHQLTGEWVGFYSNPDIISRLRLATPIGGWLWLAAYGPNDGHHHVVSPPAPWHRIRFHQYTSRGRIAGAVGDVDLSTRYY
jgi:lysozyme